MVAEMESLEKETTELLLRRALEEHTELLLRRALGIHIELLLRRALRRTDTERTNTGSSPLDSAADQAPGSSSLMKSYMTCWISFVQSIWTIS